MHLGTIRSDERTVSLISVRRGFFLLGSMDEYEFEGPGDEVEEHFHFGHD